MPIFLLLDIYELQNDSKVSGFKCETKGKSYCKYLASPAMKIPTLKTTWHVSELWTRTNTDQ